MSNYNTEYLNSNLYDNLVCPVCKNKLDKNLSEKRIDCNVCKLGFPIKNNITMLLVEESIKID